MCRCMHARVFLIDTFLSIFSIQLLPTIDHQFKIILIFFRVFGVHLHYWSALGLINAKRLQMSAEQLACPITLFHVFWGEKSIFFNTVGLSYNIEMFNFMLFFAILTPLADFDDLNNSSSFCNYLPIFRLYIIYRHNIYGLRILSNYMVWFDFFPHITKSSGRLILDLSPNSFLIFVLHIFFVGALLVGSM